MSPIEIFINEEPAGTSSAGPSEIKLPEPPGGEVNWFGDESETGIIVAGEENEGELFELNEIGQKAEFEFAGDLSAGLFPNVENTKKVKVIIKRI